MKTVLITGCSSGFGFETARLFLQRGWLVVASMRTPRHDLLPASERLRVIRLDVTNEESICRAVDEAGPIDVLVNNAGIGLMNALEGVSMREVREVFATNTFAAMAMIQAVLPQFRLRGAGVIVNVTSSVTLKPLPLLAVYTASKAAINAFSESLALELEPFGIRVRLVIPGLAPSTRFGENAKRRTQSHMPEAYVDFAKTAFSALSETPRLTEAGDVAEAVWMAATNPKCPMHVPAGADAVATAEQRG